MEIVTSFFTDAFFFALFSRMRIFLLFLLFLFSGGLCYAQQPQSWLIYFGQSKFKDSKFSLHHEVQFRDHTLFGDHNQSLFRVGGQYQFKSYLQGTMGYGFIYSEQPGSPNFPTNEHRIYQEALFSHGLKKSRIKHRVRLEERFIDGQDFLGRFRYSFFIDVPLTKRYFTEGGMYLAFYDEIFLNISDSDAIRPFDRNRLYGGFGYKLKDNIGLQLGYMMQHVGSRSGTNHMLLSVHHTINWR